MTQHQGILQAIPPGMRLCSKAHCVYHSHRLLRRSTCAFCRHLADPATKTTGALRAALAQTGLLAKLLAPFEPAWFGSCRVDVAHWGKILQMMQPLVTRIAVLESLLEGGWHMPGNFLCRRHLPVPGIRMLAGKIVPVL